MSSRQRICVIYRRQVENLWVVKRDLQRIERQLCAFKVSDLLLCATSESYTILRNTWFLKTELSQVLPPPSPVHILWSCTGGRDVDLTRVEGV